jgi:hypothetical protein
MSYGKLPLKLGQFKEINLNEVMYYLYLPILMDDGPSLNRSVRLPDNVKQLLPLVQEAQRYASYVHKKAHPYKYMYLSARKGWATPDSPLNRPGWHCDGFGTDDLNFVWWVGAGTRFSNSSFRDISKDHIESLKQFAKQAKAWHVYPERTLYALDRYVVHATPEIRHPGEMRQYVKISLSNHRYNLYGNSHNYLFDYQWPLVDRETVRNDTHKAQMDYA